LIDKNSPELQILIGGQDGQLVTMPARMGNRHGMISGATGTGKTVTLQVLAESFSSLGVPVFMADVKGDLSGIAAQGVSKPAFSKRAQQIGLEDLQYQQYPTLFWDIFGKHGHPIRVTISDVGPLLLSNCLQLNDTQSGILYACFKIADDNGLLLLDLKDLRSMLSWMSDSAKELKSSYGNISSSSVGAIQRKLLVLEEQKAQQFFGEPAIKIEDLMITDFSGNGVISILDVRKLMSSSPQLYATFLLWLLSELFEDLPEVGDIDRPKLILFFDEAHLLFNRAPIPLLEKIEQVVRLIRSKGVGVFFVSQSPLDIPEDVLGQLGCRIQHALRAFTPKDKKVVNTIADTFRPNPKIDTRSVITELGIGEALVSVLDQKGSPTPVERVLIRPPQSRLGPLNVAERQKLRDRSPIKGRYDIAIDRESAHEILKIRANLKQTQVEASKAPAKPSPPKQKNTKRRPRSNRQSIGEAMLKSAARTIGSQIGRQIIRGILGSLQFGRK